MILLSISPFDCWLQCEKIKQIGEEKLGLVELREREHERQKGCIELTDRLSIEAVLTKRERVSKELCNDIEGESHLDACEQDLN